jgi:hypothetical protein
MAVMAREAWTDERLDDLKGQVEKGFDDVKGGFREVKEEFREVRGEIAEVRGEVRELRTETNARFDSLQRTLIIGFAGIAASVIGAVLGAVILG